jgi:hypothetical protein
VIDENGLEIRNDSQSIHHWTSEGHNGESVIHLTVGNRPITKWSIQAYDHATGSDHKVLDWEVDVNRQEQADHERVVGWNFAAMLEEDTEVADKLWTEQASERAHLDAECTEHKVEQQAAWCQQAMNIVLETTGKKISICAKSKRW